jgi:hypothetical protein
MERARIGSNADFGVIHVVKKQLCDDSLVNAIDVLFYELYCHLFSI